jgi:phage repressor protein C with HTH and peptisase S24 domain
MEGIHDRLRQFLKYEKITQQRVADDMGRTLQYVNGMVNGRSSVGKKVAARLQELYGVSSGWLLTGEGTMYAHSSNNETEVVSEVPVVTMEPTKGRPYYNVDFRLGFDIMTNDQTTNPDYMIDFPPYNDVDCWVNAHGDSMAPTISSGDIVALKHIEDHSYLINGEIYAIVTTNGLRTIKRIRDNGETFTLIADNHEVGEQIIPKNLVTHVYHVRGTIKMF